MFLTANLVHNGHHFMPSGTTLEVDDQGVIIGVLEQPNSQTDFLEGILTPGFVNAHCHLELSHMKGAIPKHTQLIPFLQQITFNRNNYTTVQKEVAIQAAFNQMKSGGIVAVGDIANTTDSLAIRERRSMHFHTFVEAIGFNAMFSEKAFINARTNYDAYSAQTDDQFFLKQNIVPHAPYSVSPALFQLIDEFCPSSVISIHNQESAEENLFYLNKTGAVLDLLNGFNIDHTAFTPTSKTSLQSYMEYFQTKHSFIFVHNTFSSPDDIAYLNSRKLDFSFCLCPNANLYIENQLPPVALFKQLGVRLCLGTDSLASNDALSIIDEMNVLLAQIDGVTIEEVLKWATYNGANALNMTEKIGSFELGKRPGVNLLTQKGNQLTLERVIA